jgi:hypothetical protein
MVAVHCGEQGVAKGDLRGVVVDIQARSGGVSFGGGLDRGADLILDIGEVEAGSDDGLEIWIRRVGVLREVGVEVGLEVAAPQIFGEC